MPSKRSHLRPAWAENAENLRRIISTNYPRRADSATLILQLIDEAPEEDKADLMAIVLTEHDARHKALHDDGPAEYLSEEAYSKSFDRVANMAKVCRTRTIAGAEAPRDLAVYFLKQLRKLDDDDRIVGLVAILDLCTPYAQLADDWLDVDQQYIATVQKEETLIPLKALLFQTFRQDPSPMQTAAIANRILSRCANDDQRIAMLCLILSETKNISLSRVAGIILPPGLISLLRQLDDEPDGEED